MIWIAKHPQFHPDMLGYIPYMFSDQDPRPAKEQVNVYYAHGGGWTPMEGFTMLPNEDLKYPEDPPMRLLAETVLHNDTAKPELIRFYDCSWVAIIQQDGAWEVSRMD